MEKEEKCIKCFTILPRKKLLFVFVAVNLIFWVIYNNSCFSSYMNYNYTLKKANPIYKTIYNVSLFHIPLLTVKDMAMFYLEITVNTWCFRYGIDTAKSKRQKKCICVPYWYGNDCGIPAAVWNSTFLQEGKNNDAEIRRRTRPRRIIVSYAVDNYLDLLDINIHTIFSIVDLFLTVEDKNNHPSILDRFKEGYLIEYQSKIMPVQLNKSLTNKRDEDFSTLMLSELWSVGWQKLADFRPDDIFLFSHVTSIISKDVLLFLKFYDGFPEPFFLELRPVLFKFWWKIKYFGTNSKVVPFKPTGCTFQFIASMCEYRVAHFFLNQCLGDLQLKASFEKKYWPINNWSVGNTYAPSGWQCSLCCRSECIQTNIKKILKKDVFLDINVKNISEINHFIESNNLFNSKNISLEVISNNDAYFAPDIIRRNKKFRYLIDSSS